MQALNWRFYRKFSPALLYECKLYDIGTVSKGFFLLTNSIEVKVFDPLISLKEWFSLPVKEI
jgi:hypothetical protein